MIVDAHIHLFRNGYTGFAGRSPLAGQSDTQAYEQLAAQHGIDAALVVCYEEAIDPGNNDFVRELAAGRPWISSVAYLPNEAKPGAARVNALLQDGHIGIALYLPDAAAVERVETWPRELWRHLDNARAIVSLNAPPEAIARLESLVERMAGCTFLFSHMGLPGRVDSLLSPGEAAARLDPLLRLAPLANVAVKLSGLYAIDPHPPHVRAQPFVDLLLERFSASRLHWGSDFSPVLEFSSFEQARLDDSLSGCDENDRRLIMGDGLAARIRAARPRS